SALGFNLEELEQTVARLHNQLRNLDIETEAQILHRFEREQDARGEEGFDPLEFDRFSTMQQLSRSLMETVNDLVSIKSSLGELHKETDTLLQQQARLSTDLQDGLLRTRMVAFSTLVPRLQRLVRQTCATLDKEAALEVRGAEGEMDRAILDRMVAPLEHILRNAISHGIEPPERREAAGKPRQGRIRLELGREGGEVVLVVSDDGVGFNLESIRRRAVERGLLAEDAQISDHDLMQFVLESGFSTAEEVTQVAGRGVGMDVVANEVKQLGGSLQIGSRSGEGTWFTIRLPFTLAIAQGMLVQLGEEVYAVPHAGVEGVVRIGREPLEACYAGRDKGFSYAGRLYPVRYLGQLLGTSEPELPEGRRWFPLLLVRVGEQRLALQVDALLGNRQIVVKSAGVQLSSVRWVSGGTILSDGRVAMILDVHALARMAAAQTPVVMEKPAERATAPDVTVMVVDDSVTVRKVTSRLLERHHMGVILAKDGQDALAKLQDQIPDVMLLDIEMPRMDGYELARHMRNSPQLRQVPIIMITSRVGDKHRRRAEELGVKRYLGKPYQETELMDNIFAVLVESYA
ncbi:MAG TPA: hybrid sensor histidine kinase/response regulator, partial [Chromatiales bacterium]|nr:hybrid sensor histidine kinase/response regulator [Chromatiales bacterium]